MAKKEKEAVAPGEVEIIPPGLKTESVSVQALAEHPENVRLHPGRNVDAIKASLAEFGQQKPIVVSADGLYVLAGNGTLRAASELGWERIDVVRSTLTGARARAYMLADNRTTDLSVWDPDGLVASLAALRDEDARLVELAGWDETEAHAILDASRGAVAPDAFPQVGDDLKTDHACPKCGYTWSGPCA